MKKSITLIILIFTLIATGSIVNAASFKASVTPPTITTNPGDEITVTFSVSDIDLGEDGMTTIEGTLDYDRTIFEAVKQENVAAQGSWTIKYNDEDTELNGKFLAMIPAGGIKTAQDIVVVTLKVKQDAQPQTTTISIKNIVSNDGENLIEESDKNVTVTIAGSSSSGGNDDESGDSDPNNPNGQGGQGSGSQDGNGGSSSDQNGSGNHGNGSGSSGQGNAGGDNTDDLDMAQENIPQAGANEILAVIGIITFIIIGTGSFIAYRRNRIN